MQNVPGAGSLTLTNQLYNTAARDGTVMGAITNGMPTAPLLSPDTARFDISKFGWLGSTAPETIMVMVWHTSGVNSIQDLFDREVVVGGVAHGTATVDNPLMANAFLGTKFKIVSGYEGTTHIDLAMERGEVQGHAGIGLVTAKARNQQWFAEKKVKIVAQYGFKPHPELMDVPLFEMPKDEAARQAVTVIIARQEYGRPLLTPPGVPADRLAALRRAFDAAMQDPELRADAARQTLEINPVKGEELDALSARIMATPPDVAARLRKVLDPANSGKIDRYVFPTYCVSANTCARNSALLASSRSSGRASPHVERPRIGVSGARVEGDAVVHAVRPAHEGAAGFVLGGDDQIEGVRLV